MENKTSSKVAAAGVTSIGKSSNYEPTPPISVPVF